MQEVSDYRSYPPFNRHPKIHRLGHPISVYKALLLKEVHYGFHPLRSCLYQKPKCDPYDFKVDTTATSPFEAARLILKFVDDNPVPKAFQKLAQNSWL